MTQAPDRKRYEGQIDNIDIRQVKNGRNAGSDFLIVKLKTATELISALAFDEEVVQKMRGLEIGSLADLLIDEKPGKLYQGEPQTDRTIVEYTPIYGPSGDPAVEGYYHGGASSAEKEDELFGGPVKSNDPPAEQKPYVSTEEQKNRNIHASVALEQAVRAHGNFSEPTAKEILSMAHMFYKGLRWISSTDGLEGADAEA